MKKFIVLAFALSTIASTAFASDTAPYIAGTGGLTSGNYVKSGATVGQLIDGGSGSGGGAASVPQGRLTLTTGVPVMIADATAQTTIRYDTYQGNLYPNWDGAAMQSITITGDEITMGLDAGSHIVSGKNYDIFGLTGGIICAGPAWSSDTARGTGAGTTELQLKSGVWTNKVSITNCWGGASGTTDRGVVAANQGTYLGSFRATANGQTKMVFSPAAAGGGNNSCICLYNAYNRVSTTASSFDNNSAWTTTAGASTWEAMDNSASNRVSWLDGLAQTSIVAISNSVVVPVVGSATITGVGFDSITADPTIWAQDSPGSATSAISSNFVSKVTQPLLGFHYAQGMQIVFNAADTVEKAYIALSGGF